jgi:hypothetical protein
MITRACMAAAILGIMAPLIAAGGEDRAVSNHYKALTSPLPPARGTWAVLDFDGARRPVEPYLSSLASGEFGIGVIVSPPFAVAAETITLTVCGHDGQGGGQEKNYVALVDAASGEILKQIFAPGSDPMQERSWDVKDLAGRKVRIEVHDGIAAGAYAWIGVGEIDAGAALKIDFRQGMPADWEAAAPPEDERTEVAEVVEGGIPFLRRPAVYTIVPREGALEISCGFVAQRLFLLGGTVARGKPLETYGHVEIVYRDGPPERFPLMLGFTLDGEGKLPSPSKAMHVHPSGDQFQYYLVLAPRPEVIEKIGLARNREHDVVPRITAITCQTEATGDNLLPLPDCRPGPDEQAWIRAHTISQDSPHMEAIVAQIRRAHKME